MGFRRRLSMLAFLIVGCMIPKVGKDRDTVASGSSAI